MLQMPSVCAALFTALLSLLPALFFFCLRVRGQQWLELKESTSTEAARELHDGSFMPTLSDLYCEILERRHEYENNTVWRGRSDGERNMCVCLESDGMRGYKNE